MLPTWLLLFSDACPGKGPCIGGCIVSIEDNKTVVQRITEEVWNRSNLDAANELFAPDFSRHGQVLGPAGVKTHLARLSTERPDLHYRIEDIFAEGDRVVIRWTSRGTYTGAPIQHPLFGRLTPPAGTVVASSGINIFRLVNGKVVEVWEYGDLASVARQLGVLPPVG